MSAAPKGKGEAWIIKDVKGPHTCKSASKRKDHTALTASVIADVIMEDIKEEPAMSIKEVARAVRRIYPYVIPHYNRLWRGRELAVCRCFGTWQGSYNLLAPLLIAITGTNPGTRFQQWHVSTDTPGEVQFKGIAWAFGPCIEAFRHLRPVISIDACFMSGRYGGALLIACAYDAENQLLPISFAIVQQEDGPNWGFFMSFVRREVVGNRFVCVISDQHLGIKHVLNSPNYGWNTNTGEAVHRYCMQHISENLCKNTGEGKWLADRFKIGCKRKKPRRMEEMFREFARVCMHFFFHNFFRHLYDLYN